MKKIIVVLVVLFSVPVFADAPIDAAKDEQQKKFQKTKEHVWRLANNINILITYNLLSNLVYEARLEDYAQVVEDNYRSGRINAQGKEELRQLIDKDKSTDKCDKGEPRRMREYIRAIIPAMDKWWQADLYFCTLVATAGIRHWEAFYDTVYRYTPETMEIGVKMKGEREDVLPHIR